MGPLEVRRKISPVIVDLRSEKGKWYRHVHIQELKPAPENNNKDDDDNEDNEIYETQSRNSENNNENTGDIEGDNTEDESDED